MEVCAKELYAKGVIDHLIRSGLNWDMDGMECIQHTLLKAGRVPSVGMSVRPWHFENLERSETLRSPTGFHSRSKSWNI